jgi:hypothetical protein
VGSEHYLCLGGVEITNSARVLAYMRNGLKPHTMRIGNCGCTDLGAMLGDPEYRLPALDTAAPPPWVDPAEPDSYDFAGLLVTEIEGIESAPVSRPVVDRIGDGAVVGRRRYGPRTITVSGLLVGGSCCAIDYGMRWLTTALRGSLPCASTGGCAGDDLEYLTCCPQVCQDAPDFESASACAEPYWRTLREVSLVDAPKRTGTVGAVCSCCDTCPAVQVTFTLLAGRPHALRLPVTVTGDGETWIDSDTESACVTWSNAADCAATSDGCGAAADSCMDVALAAIGCSTTRPPELPVPDNPCACEPLTRRRHCVEIPSSVLTPIWSDVVPDIEIYSGGLALRAVRVRFYPNPLGRDIGDLDECGFCSEINIAVVPQSSTIRVDGTRQSVTVTCPGSSEVAGGGVTGTNGGPYTWPVLDCGVPYIACFEADAATIAPDATITVRVVSREV